MKHPYFFLTASLGASFVSALGPQPVVDTTPAVIGGNGNDKNLTPAQATKLNRYNAKFMCYKYHDNSEASVTEQCKEVCVPNPNPKQLSASTCWYDSDWFDAGSSKFVKPGTKEKDIPAHAMKHGTCGCDDPIILLAGDMFLKAVTEAGKIIEKVVCPALQALDIVIEIGQLAIPPPGKAITGGMIAAVRTAKAYKYAYKAEDAAHEWADMIFGGLSLSKSAGCGEPPFSLAKLVEKFLDFADVPDDTIPGGMDYRSLPCPKKGCKGTKHGEKKKNDDKKDDDKKKDDEKKKEDEKKKKEDEKKKKEDEKKKKQDEKKKEDDKQPAKTSTSTKNNPHSTHPSSTISFIRHKSMVTHKPVTHKPSSSANHQPKGPKTASSSKKDDFKLLGNNLAELMKKVHDNATTRSATDAKPKPTSPTKRNPSPTSFRA